MSTSACLESLVAVRRIALGLEDPVEPLDVAVPLPVVDPVELREALVALELADDAVVVEADPHLAADVVPALELLVGHAELVSQLPRWWSGRRSRTRAPGRRPRPSSRSCRRCCRGPGTSDPG